MTDRENNQLILISQMLEYIYRTKERTEPAAIIAMQLMESLYMKYKTNTHLTIGQIKANAYK